ncbi:LysR family transcriptional regulator [Rhizobium sp. L1K21]|uniref:LysR family transcriptional regulator n=1 Tax=Rhizobium sp. L1K21 TaxID=2954933 RepID=UPI002093F3E1|nr:LysR family transcriptional regulator [Rhizobium sp. L1K21]MCO6188109.1 LysR family transcriptional regulator [Rhizobium sp. L1K21]
MENLDWNLIRSFLAVAETGSLLAGAAKLNISQPTIGRHIDELEATLSLTLFARGRSGAQITEAGLSLLDEAKTMAAEADRFLVKAAGRSAEATGAVRITASDVVATYVLPPVLVALKDAEPGIDVELVPTNTVANLLSRDADIAVRMVRPVQNDVIAVKVNDLVMGTYAHRNYLSRFGTPRHAEALYDGSHRLIGFDRDPLILNAMAERGFRGDRSMFTFRTDDQVAYWELIRAGAGIGFGSRWIARQMTGIVRILPDLELPTLPMWLASHQELRHSLKIRRAMDFLRAALSDMLLDQ